MDEINDAPQIKPSQSSDSAADEEPCIVIGRNKVQVSAVHSKIIQDIAFLEDRITQIKKSSSPNSMMLKTYQDMLNSRQSVLAWLEHHDMVAPIDSEKTG